MFLRFYARPRELVNVIRQKCLSLRQAAQLSKVNRRTFDKILASENPCPVSLVVASKLQKAFGESETVS